MDGTLVTGGFPGQRMQVVPRPVVARALAQSPTDALVVTDAGHFPRALWHGIDRPTGADEAIVIICGAGRGWCTAEPGSGPGNPLPLGPGRVLLIPRGVAHRYWTDRRDPWSIWWLHLQGRSVAGWLARFGATDRPVTTALRDHHRASGIVGEVITTLSGDINDTTMISAAAQTWALLGLLLGEHRRDDLAAEPVRAAQQRMQRDLTRTPSVPELAAELGLSPSHFSALFRRATGGGVLAYLKALRMSQARELLAMTTVPIGTIAHQVGYPDPFYFSRQFHGVHGCSPTAYRQRLHAGLIGSPASVPGTDPDAPQEIHP